MLAEVWRDMKHRLAPVITKADGSEFRMEIMTGGVLDMWSLENPGAARGRKYHGADVDEAAHAPNLEDAITNVILPTLTDYGGRLTLASTPNGRNYFQTCYMMADSDPNWASFHAPTVANPYIRPEEVELLRGTMGDLAYRQEYLAEFLEADGLVFRGVEEAATCTPLETGYVHGQYIFGIDFGVSNDFTVIQVLDGATRKHVWQERFTNKPFNETIQRIQAVAERFKPRGIIAEENSIGRDRIDELSRMGLNVTPFLTNNASKAAIIQSLSLAIENRTIHILNDPILKHELVAFEGTKLPSGLMRYSAPEGLHDDCVMALALALEGLGHGGKVSVVHGKASSELSRVARDW